MPALRVGSVYNSPAHAREKDLGHQAQRRRHKHSLQAQIGAKDVECIVIRCRPSELCKETIFIASTCAEHTCACTTKRSSPPSLTAKTMPNIACRLIGAKDVECIVVRCVRENYATESSSLPAQKRSTQARDKDQGLGYQRKMLCVSSFVASE